MTQKTTFIGTLEMAKIPIGNIRVFNKEDSYIYKPKEDVTSFELAHLMRLFLLLCAGDKHYTNYDSWGFIEQHELQRHFEKVVML